MAVTLGKLAVQLRIADSPTLSVPEPNRTILTDLLSWALSECVLRAPGAAEPAFDQAVYTLCAYVYDWPTAARGEGYANAWANSGAQNILRRWELRRAVVLVDGEGEDVTAGVGTVQMPEAGGVTVAEIRSLIRLALIGVDTGGGIGTGLGEQVLSVDGAGTLSLADPAPAGWEAIVDESFGAGFAFTGDAPPSAGIWFVGTNGARQLVPWGASSFGIGVTQQLSASTYLNVFAGVGPTGGWELVAAKYGELAAAPVTMTLHYAETAGEGGGFGGGLEQRQVQTIVDAAIAAHRANASAHHSPPGVVANPGATLTASEANILIQARIAQHAADEDAHHEWPLPAVDPPAAEVPATPGDATAIAGWLIATVFDATIGIQGYGRHYQEPYAHMPLHAPLARHVLTASFGAVINWPAADNPLELKSIQSGASNKAKVLNLQTATGNITDLRGRYGQRPSVYSGRAQYGNQRAQQQSDLGPNQVPTEGWYVEPFAPSRDVYRVGSLTLDPPFAPVRNYVFFVFAPSDVTRDSEYFPMGLWLRGHYSNVTAQGVLLGQYDLSPLYLPFMHETHPDLPLKMFPLPSTQVTVSRFAPPAGYFEISCGRSFSGDENNQDAFLGQPNPHSLPGEWQIKVQPVGNWPTAEQVIDASYRVSPGPIDYDNGGVDSQYRANVEGWAVRPLMFSRSGPYAHRTAIGPLEPAGTPLYRSEFHDSDAAPIGTETQAEANARVFQAGTRLHQIVQGERYLPGIDIPEGYETNAAYTRGGPGTRINRDGREI